WRALPPTRCGGLERASGSRPGVLGVRVPARALSHDAEGPVDFRGGEVGRDQPPPLFHIGAHVTVNRWGGRDTGRLPGADNPATWMAVEHVAISNYQGFEVCGIRVGELG